jgi:hypothetical protein
MNLELNSIAQVKEAPAAENGLPPLTNVRPSGDIRPSPPHGMELEFFSEPPNFEDLSKITQNYSIFLFLLHLIRFK